MSGFIEEDCMLDPAPAAKARVLEEFGAHIKEALARQRDWIQAAVPALTRLIRVCAQKTGQSYTVRTLLYSLWNGQPASLLEVVTLDYAIKRDVCAVLLAFGCEPGGGTPSFFYDEIQTAFAAAGLFEWFCEASTASNDPD